MIGINEDPNHVGRGESVTTLEDLLDTIWVGVECAHEHVHVRRVVNDLRFGLESSRFPFVRTPFLKLRYRRRTTPRRIIVLAVNVDRAVSTHRGSARISRRRYHPRSRLTAVIAWSLSVLGNCRLKIQGEADDCECGSGNEHTVAVRKG